jgi:hypothetical protein
MTETTTPERAALLLADARRFAGIKSATWPEELQPGQLAALIAGGCKGDRLADFRRWRDRLRFAIESAPPLLAVRTERKPPGSPWMLGGMPKPWGRDAFGCVTFAESKALERHFIASAAAAAWLDAIGEPAGEYVRAWLGDESPEEANGSAAPWSNATESGAGELATTAEVRAALALATGDQFDQFERALGDAPKWIKSARRDRAGKSKAAGYLWNVAELAEAVTAHYRLKRKAVHAAIAGQWPIAAEHFSL